jgi:hypothetical protein
VLLAYKNDNSRPNPFEEPDLGEFTYVVCVQLRADRLVDGLLNELRDQLAREDLEQRKAGVIFPHEMSPAAFLRVGLDIEAAQ